MNRPAISAWRTVAATISAALVALQPALAGGPRSEAVTFVFDHGVTISGGGQVAFSRATATLDDSGEPVGPDTMRFAGPRLLCGAPDVTVVPGTTGSANLNILATDVTSDGTTPAFLVHNADWGLLQIHTGTIAGNGASYNAAPNAQKGNLSDFLRDSIDNQSDEAWIPKAGMICHGSAVLHCNVAKRDAQGNWHPNRVGFAVCNLADLAGPKQFWWRRHALSDVLTQNTQYLRIGSTWSLQSWSVPDRDGTRPTRYWVVATDYRNSFSKDGGVWVVFPVSRSGPAASDWAADTLVELPGRYLLPGEDVTHAHAAALTRFGAKGLIALGARGDGLHYNANYTWTINDEFRYREGASPIADGYQWLAGATAWTGPRIVDGNVTTAQSDASARRLGNQWVSIAPAPTPGTYFTGSDETNQSIWVTDRTDTDPAHLTYTPVYGASATNWIMSPATSGTTQARYLSFHIRSESPNSLNSRYVAQLGPGQFETERRLNSRVLYSPDGVLWGQCWSQGENELTVPHIAGGRIWAGSWGTAARQGIRSTPAPVWRAARPLRLAPGATNFAASAAPAHDVGQGNSALSNPTLPVAPPASGGRYRIKADPAPGGASSAELGTFRLAIAVPGNAGRLRMKYWIRPLPPEEGGVSGSTSVQARLVSSLTGAPNTAKYSGYSANLVFPGSGVWTPVVFSTDLSTWGAQPGDAVLELQLRTYNGICVPMAFDLAIDSVVVGDGLPSPGSPSSSIDQETCAIHSMAFDNDWTVLAAGMVPFDNWDRTLTQSAPRPLLALTNDRGDRWLQVFADATANALTARFWNGSAWEADVMRITGVWFSTGSPVLIGITRQREPGGITYCEGDARDRYVLYASVGGTVVRSADARCFDLDGPLSQLRFASGDGATVTPMDWFGGSISEGAMAPAQVALALQTLSFLPACRVDFDGDGFVTGLDFDLFVAAFEAGEVTADFDGDGFLTGLDYDQFVGAYEAGC